MPTKIGFHAFHVTLYMHENFVPILFLTPMDYPWSSSSLSLSLSLSLSSLLKDTQVMQRVKKRLLLLLALLLLLYY